MGSALALGILVSLPQGLHMLDSRYQGIPVHLNSDEFSYMPRLMEALLGRSTELGTAVTGGEERLPVLQPALPELVYGFLFRPLGLSIATVLTILDFLEPALLFLALVAFLRSCGLDRRRAYIAAVLFCVLQLYNLGRPIHQRLSFLLTIVSLTLLIEGLERRVVYGILGGILMGLLIDVYFWAWTAAFGWYALLLVFEFLQWASSRAQHQWFGVRRPFYSRLFMNILKPVQHLLGRMEGTVSSFRVQSLLFFGGAGVVAGMPFLWKMYTTSRHPLYPEVFFRSGMGQSHAPESWPWTILFAAMAAAIVMFFWTGDQPRRNRYLACTVIAAFALLNQHIIHGTLFLFASHYLFFLVLAAVMALTYAWGRGTAAGAIIVVASGVFLAGIVYDNRSLLPQWWISAQDFEEQHLANTLPILAQLPRTTILSDPLTSSFIASFSQHDVLFTHYIQHEMRSHKELAERYCLTQVPLPAALRKPEEEPVLVYGAAYDAIEDPVARIKVRGEELSLVADACRQVDTNPAGTMERYKVLYILWDEARNPDWDLLRLPLNLRQVGEGEGWSLWKVM